MATLDLFNTLSGTIQPLMAVGAPELRMYCCGPTVYDYGHIGNFRTFLHVDVLRRFLRQQGLVLHHVMNITDVDDKIIRNAARAELDITTYSRVYETAFFEDMDALGIERPETIARATECIPEMVELVERLGEREFAYQTEDGSWYFRLAKDKEYGKLSKKDLDNIEDGARVDVDEYEKDAARDFALWKAVKPLADGTMETSWETAIGAGAAGVAPGVLGDGGEVPGAELRPARGRRGPDVSAPRERDRAVGVGDGRGVRAALDACAVSAG